VLHGTHINPKDRYEAVIIRGVVEDKYWFLISYNYIAREKRCHSEIITYL